VDEDEIEAFWRTARARARLDSVPGYFGPSTLEVVRPPTWAFGDTPDQADRLLALVLDGTKTATASAAWEYQTEGEPLPAPGALGIVLDGAGRPRVLLATTEVLVVPFDEVDEDHAHAEGEGDRSLTHWRETHERFFGEHTASGRPFRPDMPVVLERFQVLYARS
jgi:uncharacterized protein YhfF